MTRKRALEIATATKMEGLIARFGHFQDLDEARVDDQLRSYGRRKIHLAEWAPEVYEMTGRLGLASHTKRELTINGAAAACNLWNCQRN